MRKSALAASVVSLMLAQSVVAAPKDFGVKVEDLLSSMSVDYFGIVKPLEGSAEGSVAREDGQDADDLIKLAHGLKAEIVTRSVGNKADMFSFWPNESNATHMVLCIEGGRENLGTTLPSSNIDKYNPAVQTVDLQTGEVKTILRGMSRCDGIRTTAWGTVLATEETSTGQAYEIIDPLGFENHTVTDRMLGIIVDVSGVASTKVVKRDALPTMAWEGLTVLDNGVVLAGDELRPGTGADDKDGGAIFKYIPTVPHAGGAISDLADSPFVAGSNYAFRADCREGTSGSFPQYGQGCEIGNGAWVAVSAANARDDADTAGATGYYRPEDLHKDPTYEGEGVRFCWANTGREKAQNYGEVICGIDSKPLVADPAQATVVVNRFVEGDSDFNSVDNLAFQPSTGNVYVIEDHSNGDVFACLPDGADRDIKTDGCVKVLSVKDQSAEPTGFEFTADGKTAYVVIQHSRDSACTEGTDCADYDDYPTDDLVRITGWKK